MRLHTPSCGYNLRNPTPCLQPTRLNPGGRQIDSSGGRFGANFPTRRHKVQEHLEPTTGGAARWGRAFQLRQGLQRLQWPCVALLDQNCESCEGHAGTRPGTRRDTGTSIAAWILMDIASVPVLLDLRLNFFALLLLLLL
jgi:hypothetical protein